MSGIIFHHIKNHAFIFPNLFELDTHGKQPKLRDMKITIRERILLTCILTAAVLSSSSPSGSLLPSADEDKTKRK